MLASLGTPHHRGIDLITSATATQQMLEGELGYGADKAIEDEDVEVFACDANAWQLLGTARTDGDGHFALALADARLLRPGLHALFASSVGDRSGVGFLGYVASADAKVAIADVDGTLTTTENGIVRSIVFGSNLTPQPDAPDAFRHLATSGFQLVYLTARPRGTTELTRAWLADRGFPPGPLITASHLTLPGGAALAHKVRALDHLRSGGVPLTIGIGNRATDVIAYTRAGLSGDRIFVKEPAYAPELRPYVETGRATSFERYADLATLVPAHD